MPSFRWCEDITQIVPDGEAFEELSVLLSKRSFRMMNLLPFDVPNDAPDLRMRIRKRPETLLPGESAGNPTPFSNPFGRRSLHVANQTRKGTIRLQPYEQVDMVRHRIDRQHFLATPLHNTGHVAVQFISTRFRQYRLPPLHRKHNLDVDLCVGVGHSDRASFAQGYLQDRSTPKNPKREDSKCLLDNPAENPASPTSPRSVGPACL